MDVGFEKCCPTGCTAEAKFPAAQNTLPTVFGCDQKDNMPEIFLTINLLEQQMLNMNML